MPEETHEQESESNIEFSEDPQEFWDDAGELVYGGVADDE